MPSYRGVTLAGAIERMALMRPTKRQIITFLLIFGALMLVGGSLAAHAAEPLPCVSDSSCKPTKVDSAGDLIPMPDLSNGGGKTLFESFPSTSWFVDSELTGSNLGDSGPIIMNGLTNLLVYLWVGVVYMTIGICWWLFGSLDVPGLSDAMDTMIGAAAGTTMAWLFPTAVAVGALVAYIQGKEAKGSQFGQIAWMVAAGVLAVGLSTQPGVFTKGVENVRSAGSDLVLTASANAITANETEPFAWTPVDYSANTNENAMLRKSGDSIWRTLVVTPWCLAEFGSLDGCDKYGVAILQAGGTEQRKDVIKDMIYETEGNGDQNKGKDTDTGQWVKGSNWGPRLGVVVIALVVALIFCALMLLLGFSAIAGVMLTALLLFAGVFFAALWIIPGKPREWGVAWGEALVGSIMITFVALLTFGATLAILTALFTATASMGWAIAMGLALVLGFVAFGFRKQLAELFGAPSTGSARAALIGALVTRGASKGLGGSMKAAPRRVKNAGTATKKAARRTGTGVRTAARAGAAAARRAPGAARQFGSEVSGAAKHTRTQAGYAAAAVRTRLSDSRGRTYVSGTRPVSPRSLRAGGLRPGPQRSTSRPAPQPAPRSPRPARSTPTASTTSTRARTQQPSTRGNPQAKRPAPRQRGPQSAPRRRPDDE